MSNNTMPVTQQPYLLANAYPKPYNIWNMNFPTLNEISHLSLPTDDRPNLDSHTVSIARVYPRTPFACLLPFFDIATWTRFDYAKDNDAMYYVKNNYEFYPSPNGVAVLICKGLWIEELASGKYFTQNENDETVGTFTECALHIRSLLKTKPVPATQPIIPAENTVHFIAAFRNFYRAWQNLDKLWDEVNDVAFDDEYPFDQSFDELRASVAVWVENSVKELERGKYSRPQ